MDTNINYDDFNSSKYRMFVPKASLGKYKNKEPWSKAQSIYPLYPATAVAVPYGASVMKDNAIKIEYTVLPDSAGTKSVTWSSENPDIASVDADGVITGKSVGTTKITATTMDGTDISSSCAISVTDSSADNLAFSCNADKHTATLLKARYAGDIIVLEDVEFQGEKYTITGFADDCFTDSPDLKSVTFMAATPLEVSEKPLKPLADNRMNAYVSAEAYEAYHAADHWKTLSLYTIGEDNTQAVVVLGGVKYQFRKGKEAGWKATVLPYAYEGRVNVPGAWRIGPTLTPQTA